MYCKASYLTEIFMIFLLLQINGIIKLQVGHDHHLSIPCLFIRGHLFISFSAVAYAGETTFLGDLSISASSLKSTKAEEIYWKVTINLFLNE
jgi:hypothetical protein